MRLFFDFDVDKAKAYIANAEDKRIENMPLWVVLSILMDSVISVIGESEDEK